MSTKRIGLVLIAIATTWMTFYSTEAFPWDSKQKEGIRWGSDINLAFEQAKETGKPILVHFFSDSCPPCRMMEKNTFPNPAVIDKVENSFIPVKYNTSRNPAIAQQFGITAVPTDIIYAPNGQRINIAQGGQDVQRYQQFLAYSLQTYQQFLASQRPVQPPQPQVQPAQSYQNSTQPNTPQSDQSKIEQPQIPAKTTVGSLGSCPIDQTPSFDYSKIPDNEKAMLEYEGYCPVELGQKTSWVRGDYNVREVFEGRLYFFAGQAQKEEFDRNPAKYAPAYQGADIVAWKETHKRVQGTRYYGAWAVGRVFLFSSEENLQKFEQNARQYLK